MHMHDQVPKAFRARPECAYKLLRVTDNAPVWSIEDARKAFGAHLMKPFRNTASGTIGRPASSFANVKSIAAMMFAAVNQIVESAKALPGHTLQGVRISCPDTNATRRI